MFDTFVSYSVWCAVIYVCTLFICHMATCIYGQVTDKVTGSNQDTETVVSGQVTEMVTPELTSEVQHNVTTSNPDTEQVVTSKVAINVTPKFEPISCVVETETDKHIVTEIITTEPVKVVEVRHLDTGVISVFETVTEAAKTLGLNRGSLSNVINGRIKQTKGFVASYV